MSGLALAGTILGIGANAVSNGMNNNQNQSLNLQNWQNQRYLLGLQQNWAAQQAQAADERTRALYNDLQSPEAMREQLEKAGLSVGLMYGQGGMGGSMHSGAQASSPSATGVNPIANNPILNAETSMLMANAAKIAAETENIKADTQNKEKDLSVKDQTIKESEKLIEKYNQDINESAKRADLLVEEKLNKIAERGNIEEDTKLKQEQQELVKAQTDYQDSLKKLTDIQIEWEGKISYAKIKELEASANQMNAAAKKLGIETDTLQKTQEYVIRKIAAEAATEEFRRDNLNQAEYDKLIKEIETMDIKNSSEKYIHNYWDSTGTTLDKTRGFIQYLNSYVFKLSVK